MSRSTAATILLAVTFSLSAPSASPAQEPQEVPASTLLARLGDRDLSVADARRTADQLKARPIAVRIEMFDAIRRAYAERVEKLEREREKLHKDFARAVAARQKTNVQKLGESKIADLRKRALDVSARPGLTKEMIHTEMDPLVAELRTALFPTAKQILEQDAGIAATIGTFGDHIAEIDSWFDLCLEAAQHVDNDPAGRAHAAKAPALPPGPGALRVEAEFENDCIFGLPLDARDSKALQSNEALRSRTDPGEFAGTLELNRIRMVLGLPAVRIDERLGNAARDHSNDMRTLQFFDHVSPVPGKKTFADRASRAGTSASSENIAQGHRTGEGAIEGWWYSPGHHKNMLGAGHTRTGLGRSEETWTQMFG